jgi:DHA2 family methylenomycin A resistance protein-like MFS transporter
MLAGLLILPVRIGLVVPAMTTALLASVEKERSGIAVLGSFLAAHGSLGYA